MASAATTLQFYRSPDAEVSTADTAVGTPQDVATLSASDSQNIKLVITMPATAGTYHYGACVTAVEGEDVSNNCSPGVMIMVDVPDLTVSVTEPASGTFKTGESVTFTARVTNGGGVDSAATTLQFYRSSDAEVSTTDTLEGESQDVAMLNPGGSEDTSLAITMPGSAGTYYYGACVTVVEGEDPSNNCSPGVMIMVDVPDLTVSVTEPASGTFKTGESVTFTARVTNGGGVDSAATTLQFYRSTDAEVSTTDTTEGESQGVAMLNASGSEDTSLAITMPDTVGTYYYGACVTEVEGEALTSNNCSPGVMIMVDGPDLTVSITQPASGKFVVREKVTFTAKVTNGGGLASGATTLRFYRSTDAEVSTADTPEGESQDVMTLNAGGSEDTSLVITMPGAAGTSYFGACVTAVEGETNTANNCSSSVKVTASVPSLTISISSTATRITVSQSITLTVMVINTGTVAIPEAAAFVAMGAPTLQFYRDSGDGNVPDGTAQTVGAIAIGGAQTISLTITASATAGTYMYGACVELYEDCTLLEATVTVSASP